MSTAFGNGFPPDGTYRAVNVLRFPVGDGLELAVREQDHVGVVLRPEMAAALQCCQSFAPLHSHAAALQRVFTGRALEALDPTLLCQELCHVGLLESETALLDRCGLHATRPTVSSKGSIRTFGWITCERPNVLERSVTSYLENARAHGRAIEAVVIDGSLNAAACPRNQDALRRAARSLNVDIRYAGAAERAAYVAALAAHGNLSREILDFALGDPQGYGCSIGANRNALLLDTLGSLVLSADDDTICRPTPHPAARDGLCLYGRRDPTELWSFADRKSALAFAPPADIDIAAAHEAALGRSVSALARDHLESMGLRWGPLSTEDVRVLEAGTGHVTLSFTGLIGDSGMATHAGLLWGLDGACRSRVVDDEATYRTALESREVLRVAPTLSAGALSHCMGTAYGFDNRSLLPPFMPVRRNQDGVFGAVLSRCRDEAVFAHLPLALLHDAAPRSHGLRLASPMVGRQLSDVFLFCILAHPRSPGRHPCSTRLHQLGSYLEEVGALPLHEFQRFLRLQLAAQASVFFATLDWVKRQYGTQPAYWAADLTKCAHDAREALQHPDAIVPLDLGAGHCDRDDVLAKTRELVRMFGALLGRWPHIVTAALELREAGTRLSRPLSP
ncbi:MAG: hypothetical protein GEU99_19980 [Luteitalea sp.]|nr:hypothetical protein [Luteitalea sp.]